MYRVLIFKTNRHFLQVKSALFHPPYECVAYGICIYICIKSMTVRSCFFVPIYIVCDKPCNETGYVLLRSFYAHKTYKVDVHGFLCAAFKGQ